MLYSTGIEGTIHVHAGMSIENTQKHILDPAMANPSESLRMAKKKQEQWRSPHEGLAFKEALRIVMNSRSAAFHGSQEQIRNTGGDDGDNETHMMHQSLRTFPGISLQWRIVIECFKGFTTALFLSSS